MGAQRAIPLFLVISEATKPMRAMFRLRCSREKPSSEERCFLTMSPSRSVTGRPPICSSFTISTLARVDLPELGSPGKKTVKPCRERGGRHAPVLGRGAARGGGERLVPGPRRRAPDEEVAAAAVLSHDRVQEEFARARLAGGGGQQGEGGRNRRGG